jgi:hypothetical protein
MNERIKELMVKAGMQFRLGNIPTHISFDGTHTFNEYYVYDKFDPEKFAELIVRECRKVIADDIDDNSDDDFDLGLDHARQIIGEHFGVEE